ncbi:hypothetical protein [Gluconobacter oxydans]|uniref:hypothetical protein n=1 Tax=Gluconobacter oxydans TaxID=442 RepID=UPI0039EB68F9
MTAPFTSVLATLLIVGGGALLYTCSPNQKLLRRALHGMVPVLLEIGFLLLGITVLTTAASFCTACLMSVTLLMIVWCLLPLVVSFLSGRPSHD